MTTPFGPCALRPLPTLAFLAVALLGAPVPALSAGPPPESPDTAAPRSTTKLFVPETLVPLSQFARKDASTALTLTVAPEILSWVKSTAIALGHDPLDHLFVAVESGGSITFGLPEDWTRATTGAVTLSANVAGDCVVVSDLLLHDPAVVTHWLATANGGRGGQDLGARDGLLIWDYRYDAATSSHGLATYPAVGPNGPILNTDPAWGNPPGGVSSHPYKFASDRIALFSDGSAVHENEATPAYERYIGETYSWSSYTPLAAIWLSDRARELTGFPIAHRSHPTAFAGFGGPPDPRPGQRVANDLPVFQVVHGYLVNPEPSVPAPGYQRSLATFILPPGWTSLAPADTHPVLFHGFYDINDDTFQGEGLHFVQTLAKLHKQVPSRNVVGLLWNGGGAVACHTMHRSAFDNAARLFDDAAILLRANKRLMVFIGSSRGATTALEIASNPYRSTAPAKYDYRAVLVDVRAPQVRMGTTATNFITASYPAFLVAVDNYTGYLGSWQASWREPPALAEGFASVLLRNLFGTSNAAFVDQALSIDSPPFRLGLRQAGTGVVLRIGTNDSNGPSALLAQYCNHLRAELPSGIPVLCQIFYRFGHKVPDAQPDRATLLNMAIDGIPLTDKDEFFATDPEDYRIPRRIAPSHVPLAVELPATVGFGQAHTWAFLGEPGAHVRVRVRQVVGTPCFTQPFVVGPEQAFSVTLAAEPGDRFGTAWLDPTPLLPQLTPGPWWYEVDYDFDADGTFDRTLGYGDVALPGVEVPEFCVEPDETLGTTYDQRTNGVAEDQRFLRKHAPIVPTFSRDPETYRRG